MKKALSVFLSFIILLSVFSFSAFALTSGKFVYELENGKAVITGYTGSAYAVSIPATIGSYEVFAVGEGAFKNNTKMTSVSIPEGICEIRANAFYSCTSLATIKVPTTITRFGENAIFNTAYYNNKNNWTIRPENIGSSSGNWTMEDEMDSVPWEFIAASKLEYIYLKNTSGKFTVLVECRVAGSYSVEFTTRVIADGAVRGQTELVEFKTSQKTVTVGAEAFKGCTSLSSFTLVNDNCIVYEDAFLGTYLYEDPENYAGDIFKLGKHAVSSVSTMGELTIPEGITTVGNAVIGTKNVYLPSSVTKILDGAFTGNTSVIYGYGGTFAETYALTNGFTFVDLDAIFKGDMDFDGELTPNDYAIYYADVTCNRKMTKYEKLAGDLDLDGVVDALDLIYLEVLLNDKTARTVGDISGDGVINRDDYVYLENLVRHNCTGIGDNLKFRADIDGDGAVDAFDLIYLDLYLNGRVSL